MLTTESTQTASRTGSLWLLILLIVVTCMLIDIIVIVGLVQGLDTWHLIGLAFTTAMLLASILGTTIRFWRLAHRSKE